MSGYKAPVRDVKFGMNDVFDMQAHYDNLTHGQEVTDDLIDAVINEAARFAENIIAPLNRIGDLEGCKWHDGNVTTPTGFKDAYKQFTQIGWIGFSQPTEFGGQNLPDSLSRVCNEFYASANLAWTIYSVLSLGAITTIRAHASEELQRRFLPKMVEGIWTGTMCLTEAHCGSDLGLLRTKAEPCGDGTYKITGSKIFISAGEHDMAENIVHIVLARLPNAPEGVKGISLFIVPKIEVGDDGALRDQNNVRCGSIERKMGIHGNATCVLNFDESKGYLISPPNKGLRCMFTFINESRLGVAQQALSVIEASYQTAAQYASERLQMRAPIRYMPDKPADPIIAHGDVRRMLLTQKAFAEGGRLFTYYCAKAVDLSHFGNTNQKEQADMLLAFLTPIIKGFITEVSLEATNHGIQVLGGHGFIQEWGQEQLFRDTRITAIYEGTSAIQGIDLLERKILATRGEVMRLFLDEINSFCSRNSDYDHIDTLKKAAAEWLEITDRVAENALEDENYVNAAAHDFMMYSGYVCTAYFLAQSAVAAHKKMHTDNLQADYYKSRIYVADFYFERILPRTQTLATTIGSGSSNLMTMPASSFLPD